MRKKLAVFRSAARCCLILLVLVLSAASCGGEGGEAEGDAPALPAVKAENAEVGKSIGSGEWEVTLASPPEQSKLVGAGALLDESGEGRAGMSFDASDPGWGQRGMREAKGMWLVLPVDVANVSGDLAMLSKKLLEVTDAQGAEYPLAETSMQFIVIEGDERWTTIQDNQLVEYVFDIDDSRNGPLIFEVPEDATGLKLVMEGSEESIDLGF